MSLRVHHGLYKDETAELCHWHVPATHYLESWSDTRSYDGTASIVQPLIEPLYEGKSAHELLAVFSDQYDKKAYDLVRDYWSGQRKSAGGRRQEAGGRNVRQPAKRLQRQASRRSAQSLRHQRPSSGDFETWWRKCVHDGFIPNTALPVKTVALKPEGLGR